MFRCENEHCNTVVPPRQPVNKIITERRERTYEKKILRGKDKGKVKIINGWEIVREINVCPKCYRVLTGKAPKVVQEVKAKPQFENKPRRKFDKKFDKNKKKTWKNPSQKKSTDNRNKKQEDTPKRKKPVVEVINPIKIVKE